MDSFYYRMDKLDFQIYLEPQIRCVESMWIKKTSKIMTSASQQIEEIKIGCEGQGEKDIVLYLIHCGACE